MLKTIIITTITIMIIITIITIITIIAIITYVMYFRASELFRTSPDIIIYDGMLSYHVR